MSETQTPEVPQTLEGWYMLHDLYAVDWPRWHGQEKSTRGAVIEEAVAWLESAAAVEKGDSALYSMLTQKSDVMFVHYRESPEALNQAELSLRQTRLFDYLRPAYSYFSVIEIGLYELTALAHRKLAGEGLTPGGPEFEEAFAREMEGQRERIKTRLYRDVPEGRYICFYPMNKKRGETINWYTLSMDERRQMMRGHGRIGHKYHETVTQIIGGSVGLDDWEWGVSLHADDCLVFKKLIYEMRFDPASAIYADFGPFYVGIHRTPRQLADLLEGRVE